MKNILVFLVVLLFVGCGSKSYTKVQADSYTALPVAPSMTYSDPYGSSADKIPIRVNRMVTRRADIRVEVEKIDDAKKSLDTLVKGNGGHIVRANLYENRYSASVKVPADKLDSTLDGISKLGEKKSLSISQEDVTNQFVDNEARLKSLILFRDKMQNLLNQTTKIEEILRIEREIGRVQTEIDSIQGRLKYLKDAVALSPIEITFEEKRVYGPLGYMFNGIWWVTKKLFIIK